MKTGSLRVLTLLAGLLAAAAFPAGAALADETVLVPLRIIYPGEQITPGALREVVLAPGKQIPAAVAYRIEDLDGKVARRTLLPSRYIPTSSLREAYMVEQGAPVQVIYQVGGLTITASAICLQSGAVGEVVRVRNADSGKMFTGIVTGAGVVRVGTS
ncbi:MAG: flagellar basal body P-ring formation protein FlgA [Rhizobiales bacterium]|nr:flagellar basal body P-ring formation protein FlgA [Hyphomicrobiales bacterium]